MSASTTGSAHAASRRWPCRGIECARGRSVNGGSITRQCLDAGLLDEIRVNLAPVLLGEGVPFFGSLRLAPIDLDGPRVVAGAGVPHLYYRVRRRG